MAIDYATRFAFIPLFLEAKEMLESLDLASMEALVLHLASEQTSVASQAETLLEYCKKRYINALSIKLAHLLLQSPAVKTRTLTANLLMSLLDRSESDLFLEISPMIQTELKATLLACLRKEETWFVVKCVCSIVSEVAIQTLEWGEKDWPDLLNFVLENLSSGHHQESALLMFAQLPRNMGKSLSPYIDDLCVIFLQCLASPDEDIHSLAFGAVSCLIEQVPKPLSRKQVKELLMGIISSVLQLAIRGREDSAQRGLNDLVLLVSTEAETFTPQVNFFVESMLRIAEEHSLEERTKLIAVEVICALEEVDDSGVSMLKNLPRAIAQRLFSTLMWMISFIEDDPGWHDVNLIRVEEKAEASAVYTLGLVLLTRISFSLPGDLAVSVAIELLPRFMAAPEWKMHHAGITTLSALAEGNPEPVINKLDQVLATILDSCQDPHPRVRCAALEAVIQLTVDLHPSLQGQYHQEILSAVAASLDDLYNPRVQGHATLTVLSLFRNWVQDILIPYIDDIVSKLLVLLQNKRQKLQEVALAALASVAHLSEGHFTRHYDAVMPYLKDFLLNATDPSESMLRAESVGCISSVALAVGKEKFNTDSCLVMEALMLLQESQTTDCPVTRQIIEAWVRLSQCLGPDFVPYAEHLMPDLLWSAQLDPGVCSTAANSGIEIKEEANKSIPASGDARRAHSRTDVLLQKTNACKVLSFCIEQMKEDFFPWINPVVDIFVSTLTIYQNYDIIMIAISAMPGILLSAKLAVQKGRAEGRGMSYVQKLVINIVPTLVEALHKETDKKVSARILNSFKGCIEVSGFLFTKCQMSLIVDELKVVLDLEAVASQEVETSEREEAKELYTNEEEILIQVGDCLRALIKIFRDKFLPSLDELLTYILAMWETDKTDRERQVAFHIFHDVVQQCGEAASKYYYTYFPHLFKACTDKSQDIRQEGARGIGVCAEFGGFLFTPCVNEAVSLLSTVIGRSAVLNSKNNKGYDVAVSALGKICEFRRESIDADQVVSLWLSYLPIKNDLAEAKDTHGRLCSMVEMSDEGLLGPGYNNLPKIIAVFNEVLNDRENLATPETADRMIALLMRFQDNIEPLRQSASSSSQLP